MQGEERGQQEQSREELLNLRTRLREQIEQSSRLLAEVERSLNSNSVPAAAQHAAHAAAAPVSSRAATGISKLDDLLRGGYPVPSNVVLNGPPFSSKEIFASQFIAESIAESCPTIVLTLDREPSSIVSTLGDPATIDQWQKSGLLTVIDAYSRFVQVEPLDASAVVIDGSSNISNFMKSIDQVCSRVASQTGKYRMVVYSLTGLMTQTDEKTFIRSLQHLSQRRKAEGSVSLYLLEDGIFERKIYENVNYFMDISVEFRNETTTEYLRVRGLPSARTREWVEIIRNEGSVDLGSFDLKRVK
ncbi:MAG: RAD55 family ATPase [Thermoplasmataceae archaeon]